MPRTKSITTKRKRPAALNVSEPKLNGAAAPIMMSIAALAAQIAPLRSLAKKMEVAQFHQRKKLEDETTGMRDFPWPTIQFDAHQRSADERARAMEKLVLGSEPGNLDEALSLTLIALGELDAAVGDDNELADVLNATYALARWMIRAGATSPLDQEYYTGELLNPNAVERALAYADELAKAEPAR